MSQYHLSELLNKNQDFRNIVDNFFGNRFRAIGRYAKQIINYSVDIKDGAAEIQVGLPGFTKDDVHINYSEDNLIQLKIKDKDVYYINLFDCVDNPSLLDVDFTKAKMENGLLTLSIPNKKKQQKLIQIQ